MADTTGTRQGRPATCNDQRLQPVGDINISTSILVATLTKATVCGPVGTVVLAVVWWLQYLLSLKAARFCKVRAILNSIGSSITVQTTYCCGRCSIINLTFSVFLFSPRLCSRVDRRSLLCPRGRGHVFNIMGFACRWITELLAGHNRVVVTDQRLLFAAW